MNILYLELAAVCASAACVGLVSPLMIRTINLENKGTANPQNIHHEPTSRLGGAAVFLAYVMAVAVAFNLDLMPTVRPAVLLLISALPLQVVGLLEDITRRVSPGHRLAAAVVSAALASVLAQSIIARLDLPVVDAWLAYLPFAVPLTWFMVAGACNAINIIDGTHGLASGTALLMFLGVAIVAGATDDRLVLVQALGMIGALTSFLIWNYPRGKVFLGDAGAYFIGFMYAQLSIQLIARNNDVSAWFVVALAAYPIVETLFSIYRRKIVGRVASMQPDTFHLHSLLYTRFRNFAMRGRPADRRVQVMEGSYPGKDRRQHLRRANAQVAPRLWLHGVLCLVASLTFYHNTPALIGFAMIYTIYYIRCYRKAMRFSVDVPQLTASSQNA